MAEGISVGDSFDKWKNEKMKLHLELNRMGGNTYSLILDLDIVLVDIPIPIEITDILSVLTLLTKH